MAKKLGIGCAVVLLAVAALVILLAVSLPKLVRTVKEEFRKEAQRQQFAAQWQPPPEDVEPAGLFPEKVGSFRLQEHDQEAAIPDFEFDREGWHAVYQSDGSRIDVYVYRVNELETEALFGRVKRAYEKRRGSGIARWIQIGPRDSYARCYLSASALGQNHLWFLKGWLFVFRTRDPTDREPFVREFLKTVSSQPEIPEPVHEEAEAETP